MNDQIITIMESIRKEFSESYTGTTFDNEEKMNLLAAFDMIEDSQCAIDYYKSSVFPDGNGSYLFIYGLFQAFSLQQDAVNAILYILKMPRYQCSNFHLLKVIRDYRNDVVGHPVNRGQKQNRRYIRLYRSSIKKESFSYVVIGENTECKHVNVDKAIFDQEHFIKHILDSICEKLRELNSDYRS